MKKQKKMAEILCFLIFVFVMMAPILLYASKSVPAADDFGNAAKMREDLGVVSSVFMAALYRSAFLYHNWGGYYLSNFLNYFFCPLNRWGIDGIRIFNVVANILFFLSAYILVSVFSKHVLKVDKSIMRILYCMFIMQLINGCRNAEIYTWYCVLAAYVLPLALMFISIALFVLGMTVNWKYYIGSGVIALLVGGTSLNLVALNCGIFFLLSVYLIIDKKSKKGMFVFAAAIIGGIINALAPGNYRRHGIISQDYGLRHAINNSLVSSFNSVVNRMFNTPFLVLACGVLLIALMYVSYKDSCLQFNHPILIFALIFAGVVIVNFPVCLGYATGQIPDRCVLVQDLTLYFLTFIWVLYFGGYLKKRFGEFVFTPAMLYIAGMALLLSAVLIVSSNGGVTEFTTGKMIHNIMYGELEDYVSYEKGLLDEIENSAEDNVVLERYGIMYEPFLKSVGLQADSEASVNCDVAKFYGKKSISIHYKDE